MNPNNQQGLNLPPPVSNEQLPPVEPAQSSPEQAAMPEVGNLQPAVSAVPTPPIPMPQVPSSQVVPAQPARDYDAEDKASAAVVDDGDLIEKEMVNKAKAIVERTRDDPYKQSEELTVFKADYMKKRYNKTLKVNK